MARLKVGTSLILLFSITFALLVGGTMPYFLLYILLLILILPLIHILITLKGLKGSVKVPEKSLFTGDSVEISYSIKNNSIFGIAYLEIQSDISKKLTGIDSPSVALSLKKGGSFSNRETIHLKRRGYYELGEMKVTIRDVFGFYSFTKKISGQTSLLVYPETINLSTFKITTSQQLGELLIKDSVFQDKSRITSLREYIEGDSVKDIHWRLSAKRDNLIVKDYENRGDTYAIVLVDNYINNFKDDLDRHLEDKAVDASLSVVNYCLSNNIEVKLATQNHKGYLEINGQQKSDLKPFLEILARFKGNGALDFTSFLIPRIETLRKGSTAIIITPNLDKSIGAHGILLKTKNLNPLFIVITDMENKTGNIDQMIEKKLRQEGIPIYILDYKSSTKDLLEAYHG